MGHAIGMSHEQKRTDRDEWIRILPENIKPRYVGQFTKSTTLDNHPYDLQSVMHYSLWVSFVPE